MEKLHNKGHETKLKTKHVSNILVLYDTITIIFSLSLSIVMRENCQPIRSLRGRCRSRTRKGCWLRSWTSTTNRCLSVCVYLDVSWNALLCDILSWFEGLSYYVSCCFFGSLMTKLWLAIWRLQRGKHVSDSVLSSFNQIKTLKDSSE